MDLSFAIAGLTTPSTADWRQVACPSSASMALLLLARLLRDYGRNLRLLARRSGPARPESCSSRMHSFPFKVCSKFGRLLITENP